MSEGLASGYGEESVGGGTTKPDATSICCGPRDAAGSRSGVGILEERKLRVGVKMRLWAKPAGFCPPRGPPAPSRGRRPRAPPPGKAERRQGDDAGPRGEHHLAAARLHQDVLDDVLQQRLLQVGERREPAGGAGVSAATRHAQRSPRAASVLRREPRALRGFSLNSSPSQRYEASLFQFYRHSNCCLRGPSCRTSCCWYKWWDSNPGIGRPHLGASFGERHLAMRGCRGTGAPESPPRQRPQSSPRGRWGKRWYFSPGSRKPFKRLGSLYPP